MVLPYYQWLKGKFQEISFVEIEVVLGRVEDILIPELKLFFMQQIHFPAF